MDTQLQQARKAAILGDRAAHQQLLAMKQRARQRSLFGVSLSFCVQSILKGHVRPEEVIGISSSTTGFVAGDQKGPNFDYIVDIYIQSYWRQHDRPEILSILEELLSRITEQQKGIPPGGAWIDADMPYEWGKISYGCGDGYVGYYIDPQSNEVIHTPQELTQKLERRMA